MLADMAGNNAGRSGDEESGEVVRSGAEAKAAWRKVRWLYWSSLVGYLVAITVVCLLGRLSLVQLTLIALGLTALFRAAFIGFAGWSGVGYHTVVDGGQTTRRFTGKRPLLPAPISVPLYVVAGVLLIISGTNTAAGRWLAPVPTAALGAKDAIDNALSTPGRVVVVIFLVFFALIGAVRGIGEVIEGGMELLGRKAPDPDGPNSIWEALWWLLFTAFAGFLIYTLLR